MTQVTMPNFIIIGAAKAGATSLYRYPSQHPQIYMSPVKETNFFSLEGHRLDFSGPGDREHICSFTRTEFKEYQAVASERAVGDTPRSVRTCSSARTAPGPITSGGR